MSNLEDRIVDLSHYIPLQTVKDLPPLSAVENISYDNRLILVHLYITNVCDWYLVAGEPVARYYSNYYQAIIDNDYRLYGIHKAKATEKSCVYLSGLNLLRHPDTNALLLREDRHWWPKSVCELEL